MDVEDKQSSKEKKKRFFLVGVVEGEILTLLKPLYIFSVKHAKWIFVPRNWTTFTWLLFKACLIAPNWSKWKALLLEKRVLTFVGVIHQSEKWILESCSSGNGWSLNWLQASSVFPLNWKRWDAVALEVTGIINPSLRSMMMVNRCQYCSIRKKN